MTWFDRHGELKLLAQGITGVGADEFSGIVAEHYKLSVHVATRESIIGPFFEWSETFNKLLVEHAVDRK